VGDVAVDEAKFKELYLEHFSGMVAFFVRKGIPREEAKDLAQDVFLRVYRFRDQFAGKGTYRAWLNSIAVNTWKNWLRYIHTPQHEADLVRLDEAYHHTADDRTDLEKEAIKRELLEMLRQAMKRLPEDQYDVVVLRVYHDLAYKEIAAFLKITKARVKSRLHQAQEKLRVLVKNKIRVRLID
jgi:RNA polymerase sigma-70 factor (ECF subfamily)